MDMTTNSEKEYPFACQAVINTGHKGNIFNAQILPFSTRIASVAADKQVRVFDIGESLGTSSTGKTNYSTRESCIRVLRCHSKRTKRIVTEESPDLFLTVAEDGQVRQHDLRTPPHSCTSGEQCPAPLVKLPHALSTIALSPLTPYQFVVGGESPYAYLFDRRHTGRFLQEEWGVLPRAEDVTTCVRRFGRRSRARNERRGTEHITGAKMSAWNGHEVLLSYSADAVYLYSTRDEPVAEREKTPAMLPSNTHKSKRDGSSSGSSSPAAQHIPTANAAEELAAIFSSGSEDIIMDDDDDDDDDDEDEENDEMEPEETEEERTVFDSTAHKSVPVIYPRSRFEGHCNIETVKDVNFLGPYDEYVASGSDDGNFFIWHKSDGKLVDILEGDGSVVNVIEGHPHLPLIAVSGIDTTIKLFAPVHRERLFSRFQNAESIKDRNIAATQRLANRPAGFTQFLIRYDRALRLLAERGGDQADEELVAQCPNQ
ncbi:hypothetical protein SERLA73DRAFT_177558 [Serpula lacrymans var. lacrymans S7.3]|uniref:Uncharacterized protein n=1 Tax=Serpula lacrymans var. lacrymans (strain S7.3) TaxID=936435 RepID=F8PP46_SERL3|nr:hypothetical protein SERLA73DRAFT_177558 [Serpula lacrymans var. lacrymans S7.3]